VQHYGLAIYIKKVSEGKRRRIMEIQIFHHAKIDLIFKKNPLKETKILQDMIIGNSIANNLKFQHKPKYHLSKILILK
jgi:hypothetical protein